MGLLDKNISISKVIHMNKKHSAFSIQLFEDFLYTLLIKDESIFFISSFSSESSLNRESGMYPKSLERISWYSNSDADPNAIFKNLPNWGSEFRPQPSAMFVGTEDDDLRIWLVSPYCSSFGKDFVQAYTFNVSVCDFLQTNRSLKFFMILNGLTVAESYPLYAYSYLLDPNQIKYLQKNFKNDIN